jgi:hypothetical protein
MKRIERIAEDVASDMVADRKSFKEWVEEELYDDLDSLGEWQGFDAYNADTNGNDHLYQLHVFADDEYVRYTDESYSDAYYEQGDDWELEVDDSRMYPYSKYPFSKKEVKEWLAKSIDDGIEAGQKALNEKPEEKDDFEKQLDELEVGMGYVDGPNNTMIFKCNIPNWSLPYLVNGDSSGLEDDEVKMVDDWHKKNNVEIVNPTDEQDGFTTDTEFGDACDCTVCFVHCRK